MAINDFETLLPRLVSNYEAGRLVPFIGSGMSRATCTDWATFIEKLEAQADRSEGSTPISAIPREELIRRANTAVRRLKGREVGAFARAVRKSLLSNEADPQNSIADQIAGSDFVAARVVYELR
jgi:hypothetical protein